MSKREMKKTKLTAKIIFETLKKNREVLEKHGVIRIGLFGSFIRGEQKINSDIDFLVEFKLSKFGENFKGLYKTFIDLSDYLEKLFGKKVELITPSSLSPYIQPYIENEVQWYETRSTVS